MSRVRIVVIVAIVAFAMTGCISAIQPAPVDTSSPAADAEPPIVTPGQVSIDTFGLPYSWQANLVPATAYTADQPPGPTGLPEHIEINFGVADPADKQPGDPILYIIPVDAYRQMWDDAGNPFVTKTVDQIYNSTVALQSPPPSAGLPALPTEEIGGVNDLAVQQGRIEALPESASRSGFRFVGRWAQDANPVTNQGLRYTWQGFTNDGVYLVVFFYPVISNSLTSFDEFPASEWETFNSDPQAYIQAQAEALNALPPSEWEPDLGTLNQVVASLRIDGMVATGLHSGPWSWVSTASSGEETPVEDPDIYQIDYRSDGVLAFHADCNSGSGSYTWSGGMVGGMRSDLAGVALAECGPDSQSQQLVDSLRAAQDFRVLPGGERLRLNLPAGGPVLTFTHAGTALEP